MEKRLSRYAQGLKVLFLSALAVAFFVKTPNRWSDLFFLLTWVVFAILSAAALVDGIRLAYQEKRWRAFLLCLLLILITGFFMLKAQGDYDLRQIVSELQKNAQ